MTVYVVYYKSFDENYCECGNGEATYSVGICKVFSKEKDAEAYVKKYQVSVWEEFFYESVEMD